MFDQQRLHLAYKTVRADLLAELEPDGHWEGELSSSAFATATAISALTLMQLHEPAAAWGNLNDGARPVHLSELILGGLRWLCRHQNADGGWGDTPESPSNIATTMLAVAAMHLTGTPSIDAPVLTRGEEYIQKVGGIAALKKYYGRHKALAAPILTICALADTVPWNKVPAMPFQRACLPARSRRFARLPVASYTLPALLAGGLARHEHAPAKNPLIRMWQARSREKSLSLLGRMQPPSGGYLEAIPLTGFVVMCLAGSNRAKNPVARHGLEFLIDAARPDGSWPIATSLSTWNTTLATLALAQTGDEPGRTIGPAGLDWLLDRQHADPNPITSAQPGGWGWGDPYSTVPDADNTACALQALARWRMSQQILLPQRRRLRTAALAGCGWLLDLQNHDGGWPTFCRGWGKLAFDQSGCDLTAHSLSALRAWEHEIKDSRLAEAQRSGMAYLENHQNADGSWTPLWFGDPEHPEQENRTYGTSRVLLCYRDYKMLGSESAKRGRAYLTEQQRRDGSWGSIEETSLALSALVACADETLQAAIDKGIGWLADAIENEQHRTPAPLGVCFARLWYHEKLYPLTFPVAALGSAVERLPKLRERLKAEAQTAST